MKKIKSFLLNDQYYYTDFEITLLELVQYFNYQESLLVLEHNHLICNKQKWSDTFLNDQDKIEIVTIVGGG